MPSFLSHRKLSTSILTPGSSEGSFPSDLLSARPVLASERDIGMKIGHFYSNRSCNMVMFISRANMVDNLRHI